MSTLRENYPLLKVTVCTDCICAILFFVYVKQTNRAANLPYGVLKMDVVHRRSDTGAACVPLSWERRGKIVAQVFIGGVWVTLWFKNKQLCLMLCFTFTINCDSNVSQPDKQAVESIHLSSWPTLSSPRWFAWHGSTIWLIFTSVGFLYPSSQDWTETGSCAGSVLTSDVMAQLQEQETGRYCFEGQN